MMKKLCFILVSGLLFGIFFGCQKELPKPKTEAGFPFYKIHLIHETSVSAANQQQDEKPSLYVQYQTRGKSLLVECIVTGITFRESNESKQRVGKMVVWMDGKKKQDINAAAFVMKSLPSGHHHFKLEVVNLQNQSYGLSKEFVVNIPEK
ncbi:MAG: hypothetical protein Q8934_13935 [Bacillota bacterium]|nr:hypothetical protein [Bacillota bacterium]